MKICMLSHSYPPELERSGISTYTHIIANELANKHEVTVIAESAGEEKDCMENNVQVIRINPRIIRLPIFNIFFGNFIHKLCYSYQVNRKIKSLKTPFDIIHAGEWSFEALFLTFCKNTNIVTTIHSPTILTRPWEEKGIQMQDRLINLLEKTQTKRSKAIISPSSFLRKIVSEEWDIPLHSIQIISNPTKEIVLAKRKVPYKNFMVYYGRVEKLKGVLVLLKVLDGVFELHPDLKMLFIGTDRINIKKYLNESRHKKNIILLPHLSQEDLFPIVSKARLVILPSLFENFGLTCLEAMELGRVVIATRKTGFEEIIQDGISGFLVEPGNAKELQEKIISCLERKDLGMISKNAQKRAEDFDVKIIAEQLEKLYKQVQK